MELKMPKAYWIKPQGNGIIREEHLGGGYMDAGEVRAYISRLEAERKEELREAFAQGWYERGQRCGNSEGTEDYEIVRDSYLASLEPDSAKEKGE